MKKNLIACCFLLTAMIICPLSFFEKATAQPTFSEQKSTTPNGYISVMKSENGKIETVDETEYMIGSLAAEMDMTYHEEALKAQAVVCKTYALYVRENGNAEEYNGADISDDSEIYQGYLNVDERKKKWGDNFDEYEKRAETAVNAVKDKTVLYNGKPAMTVYFELSSGKTEDASTVWGKDVPYLKSVQSPGDKLSTSFSKSTVFSKEQMKSMLNNMGLTSLDECEKWFGEAKTTKSGYVLNMTVCGKTVSGSELRKSLGLSSSNFSVKYSKERFTITAIGSGHMVGMSQYGADYMARQGSSWQDIIKHFYTGITVN